MIDIIMVGTNEDEHLKCMEQILEQRKTVLLILH